MPNGEADAVRQLATDLTESVEHYIASGARPCDEGCKCPLARALDAVVHFVDCVERFERGELLAPNDGLPNLAGASHGKV